MLVKLAKVIVQLTLSIDVKVGLVAEEYHSSGCNEPCQIILLRIGKPGQVDTIDLRTNLGVVIEYIGGIGKEVAELRITWQISESALSPELDCKVFIGSNLWVRSHDPTP